MRPRPQLARLRFTQDELRQAQLAVTEPCPGADEPESSHPIELLSGHLLHLEGICHLDDPGLVLRVVFPPELKGTRIVRREVLGLFGVPPRRLGGQSDLRLRRQIPAREDIPIRPGVHTTSRILLRDGVQNEHTVVSQCSVHHPEEQTVVFLADVLEHADRDNPVELLVHVLVAQLAEFDALGNLFSLSQPPRIFQLLITERDADHTRLGGALGDFYRQVAPAGAHIEDTTVRPHTVKPQLGHDVVDLRVLRFVQRHVRPREVRTRIQHRRAQE